MTGGLARAHQVVRRLCRRRRPVRHRLLVRLFLARHPAFRSQPRAARTGSAGEVLGRFFGGSQPEVRGGTLTWRHGTLGWSLQGHALGRPFGLRLFERDEGAVDWQCEACPLRLEITLPEGRSLSGLGYAERLTLGLAPWALPIDELRWGRWIADTGDSSMVWIDWRGSHPLTVVFVDGSRRRRGRQRRPHRRWRPGTRAVESADVASTGGSRRCRRAGPLRGCSPRRGSTSRTASG